MMIEIYFIHISDGLWDVLSNEAAVAAMRNVFSNSSKSAADVAGDMLDIALRRGAFNQPFRLRSYELLFSRIFPHALDSIPIFDSMLTPESNHKYGRFERQYQRRSSSITWLTAW